MCTILREGREFPDSVRGLAKGGDGAGVEEQGGKGNGGRERRDGGAEGTGKGTGKATEGREKGERRREQTQIEWGAWSSAA